MSWLRKMSANTRNTNISHITKMKNQIIEMKTSKRPNVATMARLLTGRDTLHEPALA